MCLRYSCAGGWTYRAVGLKIKVALRNPADVRFGLPLNHCQDYVSNKMLVLNAMMSFIFRSCWPMFYILGQLVLYFCRTSAPLIYSSRVTFMSNCTMKTPLHVPCTTVQQDYYLIHNTKHVLITIFGFHSGRVGYL